MKNIIRILAAATLLLVSPAAAQQQSSSVQSGLAPDQRQMLRDEIRAYLLENPEVILEAIQLLEDRRNQAAAEADSDLIAAHADAIFNDGHSHVLGNPDGDVTLVEFSDYRCHYCKKAHPDLKALLEQDPNIRLIIKEFPILGPDSTVAGRMALAALSLDPSLYPGLNDALMAFPGNLTEQAAYRIAQAEGYDITELKDVAASAEIDAQLEANYQLAQVLGLQGTPSFILGDEIIRGYLPLDDLKAVVAEVRARTQAEAN